MASISKIIIGGFKSIRDRTEIPIAPITFLFGPNSAGKSAVLGAVNALRQRIEEGPTKIYPESPRDTPPPTIRNGSAYIGKERKAYAENGIDMRLGDYPNVTLGVEIEDFSSHAEPEKLNFGGRSLYWALDSASVHVEVEEFYLEGYFRASSSGLKVDQVELLKFRTPDIANELGFPMTLEFEEWKADSTFGDGLKTLGLVSINLAHPVWGMASIVEGGANFDARLVDSEQVAKFDHYRIELCAALHALRSIAEKTESPFLRQLLASEGNWLHLRAETALLSAKAWSPNMFYSSLQPSYADLWHKAGLDEALEERSLLVIQKINDILESLSSFTSLVLASTVDCLRVAVVDGDRRVLEPADVTVQFPDTDIYKLERDKFWELLSTANSYLSLYAFWLGCRHTGGTAVTLARNPVPVAPVALTPENWPPNSGRADFVNDVFKTGIFGTRHYEVKPTVWSIATKTLLSRDAQNEDGGDDETQLKVQLYLEDQNGRKLDFSQVGSGISYVMPILASLHGAKISWVAQPELHLHPAAQCEMGDVFLRAFNRGHFSVVETHSEHMLLRVLKRVRQTTQRCNADNELNCPPEAVSVLYFDPQEDGSTQVKQMRVSRLGDFKDRWPNGFFEERGKELFDE